MNAVFLSESRLSALIVCLESNNYENIHHYCAIKDEEGARRSSKVSRQAIAPRQIPGVGCHGHNGAPIRRCHKTIVPRAELARSSAAMGRPGAEPTAVMVTLDQLR
jgi:hypothetical protein